jgi:uncharacterized OB-fold protein
MPQTGSTEGHFRLHAINYTRRKALVIIRCEGCGNAIYPGEFFSQITMRRKDAVRCKKCVRIPKRITVKAPLRGARASRSARS